MLKIGVQTVARVGKKKKKTHEENNLENTTTGHLLWNFSDLVDLDGIKITKYVY